MHSLSHSVFPLSATTNNQNYVAGYKATTVSSYAPPASLMRFSPMGFGGFGGMGPPPDDDSKPKVDVKIDPKDVQAVQLNEANGSNNQNDDEKESESVVMNDEDKSIYNEFRKTLSNDAVEVIELKRLKDNVSRKIVYDALLQAKTQELKDKHVQHIERVLFHGTSSQNVAKIVNNGFNRDFNRTHRYGKGTYFSPLASESAKYCERDDEDDPRKNVMLVCKVIVGEYCIGTHDMDGSSVPYKPDKKTQYESCVNKMVNPTIFVINRDYHAIPTHIITFKYKK